MTGKILIVDAQVTNRILLKVKLGTAFYSFFQASSGQDAIAIASRNAPDLLLVGAPLPDMTLAELQAGLAKAAEAPLPALVAAVPVEDAATRLAAFEAGAAAVVCQPCDEAELQARLRAIIRQRQFDADLRAQSDTAGALGFSEEPTRFSGPSRVALLGGTRACAEALVARVAPHCRHSFTPYALVHPDLPEGLSPRPDVIVIRVSRDSSKEVFGVIGALRSAPQTRHARILAVAERSEHDLIAPLLDIGAGDAMTEQCAPKEIAFRISMQMAQKQQADAMRGRLETGLKAAVTDPLTGLYNRRYALTYLQRMISGAEQEGRSFALMVADLDHFKAVNDRHGHSAGDRVLTHVARLMRRTLPRDGMIARIGGEEFLIAIADTSLDAVRDLADRLCRAVREAPAHLPGGGGPIGVTVSIGVTLVSPGADDDWPSIDVLMGEADAALYNSKSCGRDTVTFCMRTAA